jgi:hypothetical protein
MGTACPESGRTWASLMICGTRGELENIMEEYDKFCPVCL